MILLDAHSSLTDDVDELLLASMDYIKARWKVV
jgi:hypothetical protein